MEGFVRVHPLRVPDLEGFCHPLGIPRGCPGQREARSIRFGIRPRSTGIRSPGGNVPDLTCPDRLVPDHPESRATCPSLCPTGIPIDIIYACLKQRLTLGRWDPFIGKSRQRHWLLALKKKAIAWFGQGLLGCFWRAYSPGDYPGEPEQIVRKRRWSSMNLPKRAFYIPKEVHYEGEKTRKEDF
jgi:hypothetical protein